MIDVTEHLGLVWKVINKYKYTPPVGMDDDDLFQVGCIGLIKAARKFNPELGYTFSTYAAIWIRSELQRLFHHQNRKKRQALTISIDKQLVEDGGTIADIIPDTVSVESEVLAQELLKIYKDREPVITDMLMLGYSHKEIAERLNVTRPYISQRIKKMREIAAV